MKRRRARVARNEVRVIRCNSWSGLIDSLEEVKNRLISEPGESLWFRGCSSSQYKLLPTLMRDTFGLAEDDHDQIEQDLFFEFQARAGELRSRGLSEWEYLFFSRHYGVPTRVIDWTDTFGVALYFALEKQLTIAASGASQGNAEGGNDATIWAVNPYALNKETWDHREIILPRFLGPVEDDYWDFGDLLASDGPWAWDGPVAIYPIQINERVRAQRGWFTIHGNRRDALEDQVPHLVFKIVLSSACFKEAIQFLELAGFNRFSIYPDLDNLALWIRNSNLEYARMLQSKKSPHSTRRIRQRAKKKRR